MDWKEQANATEERLRRQLVDALAGDAQAYRKFLSALASHLRAFFRKRMFQHPDEVEDLVQETLLAVHTHRHTYKTDLPLTAWVYTIARYKLVDFLRANARGDALTVPLEDDLQVFAASEIEALEARHDLETVLQTLPARQRAALKMMKVDGASAAETAAVMGMSEVAVKVSVHRSLKSLADRIKGQS
jgi:RNA polymerase sigma-70 factor, ECF subfamily